MARPLPVEYLLVDVPATTPMTPLYTFTAQNGRDTFPIENRYIDGQLQDFNALSAYISKWAPNEFLEAVSDFHLLLYLSCMDMLPMKTSMGPLLEAVRTKNNVLAMQWKEQEVWSTLETLISASSSASGYVNTNIHICLIHKILIIIIYSFCFSCIHRGSDQYPGVEASSAGENWTCNHCTFINRGELSSCEMCGLPR